METAAELLPPSEAFFVSPRRGLSFRRYHPANAKHPEWRSEDLRIRIGRHPSGTTYWVMVDGILVSGTNPSKIAMIRSLEAAMNAGARQIAKAVRNG